jgi:hypothetical protein
MDGLQFECQRGCTSCCEQKGFVYLTEQDMKRAAAYLKMSDSDFEAKYIYRTTNFLRLRKPRNAQCHFLVEGGCSIHSVKPTQCRVFPFWPELVEGRGDWKRAARYCPGIGMGPLIQIGTALETSREMRTAYPSMFAD